MLQPFSPNGRTFVPSQSIAAALRMNEARQRIASNAFANESNTIMNAAQMAQNNVNQSRALVGDEINRTQAQLNRNLQGLTAVANAYRQSKIQQKNEEFAARKFEAEQTQQDFENELDKRRVKVSEKNVAISEANSKKKPKESLIDQYVRMQLGGEIIGNIQDGKAIINPSSLMDDIEVDENGMYVPPTFNPVTDEKLKITLLPDRPSARSGLPYKDQVADPVARPPLPGEEAVPVPLNGPQTGKGTNLYDEQAKSHIDIADAKNAQLEAENAIKGLPPQVRWLDQDNATKVSAAKQEENLLKARQAKRKDLISKYNEEAELNGVHFAGDIDKDGNPIFVPKEEKGVEDRFGLRTDKAMVKDRVKAASLKKKIASALVIAKDERLDIVGLNSTLKHLASRAGGVFPAAGKLGFKRHELNAYNDFTQIMGSLFGDKADQLGLGKLSDRDVTIVDGLIVPIIDLTGRTFQSRDTAVSILESMLVTVDMELAGIQFMQSEGLPLDEASVPFFVNKAMEGKMSPEVAAGWMIRLTGKRSGQTGADIVRILEISDEMGERDLTEEEYKYLSENILPMKIFNAETKSSEEGKQDGSKKL